MIHRRPGAGVTHQFVGRTAARLLALGGDAAWAWTLQSLSRRPVYFV
jgi:hypothetical protein